MAVICVGRRTRDHFARRNYNIIAEYVNIFRQLEFETAVAIVEEFEHLYRDKAVDKVEVIYNDFKSAILQTVWSSSCCRSPLKCRPATTCSSTMFMNRGKRGDISVGIGETSEHANVESPFGLQRRRASRADDGDGKCDTKRQGTH